MDSRHSFLPGPTPWPPDSPPLPHLNTAVPGPRSRALAAELARWESPNVTSLARDFPVFWQSAQDCLVTDVDGNRFLDLTAAFGVAAVGHCNPAVVQAIQSQSARLIHGMGDVHPPALKVELARKLAEVAPGDLSQCIFGTNGSDAVEAALKTAVMATGRPGVVAFTGGYHGLSYGALEVTERQDFREPFKAQLGGFATHVPYADCARCPLQRQFPACGLECLRLVDEAISAQASEGRATGAVLAEPIQGRAGIIEPPPGWFTGLRDLCRRRGVLLIADEVFTGFGRTGRWFASEVPPDLLCAGKALGGGLPLSVCIGTPQVMAAWPVSQGEALHTSTYLGHPLACAAALASIREMEERSLVQRCARIGRELRSGLECLAERQPAVAQVRGRGLMLGLALRRPAPHAAGRPVAPPGVAVMKAALQRGLMVLPAGPDGDVVEIVPPFTMQKVQVVWAVETLEAAITDVWGGTYGSYRSV